MAMQAGSTVLADAGKAGREAPIAVIDRFIPADTSMGCVAMVNWGGLAV